jgi:hypothetical protein
VWVQVLSVGVFTAGAWTHQPGVVVEGGKHEGRVSPRVLALPVELALGLEDLDGLLGKVGEVVLADGQQGMVVLRRFWGFREAEVQAC